MVRVKFLDAHTIRVFELVGGQPVGLGLTIKTWLDFAVMDLAERTDAVRIVILSHHSVVRRLLGERYK